MIEQVQFRLFCNCIKSKYLKKVLRLLKKRKQRRKKQNTWRDNYKKLTGNDPLICVRCHIEMEFWFARYGPDKRVLNHFGLEKSDRIPIKQFTLLKLQLDFNEVENCIKISLNDQSL